MDDDEGADRVAEELGDLPLALAQAASVIQVQRISYVDYLSRLRSMPVADLLTRRSGDLYPRGAAEAILVSVRAAEATDESSVTMRLLAVIAMLSPTGAHRALVEEILKLGMGLATNPVARVWRRAMVWVMAHTTRPGMPTIGAVSVDETLARLVRLSLLVWSKSGTSVVVHRLVARVVRDHLQAAGLLAATIVDTVQTLLSLLQIPEENEWAGCEQGAELVAHALAVWDIAVHHTDRLSPNSLSAVQRWRTGPFVT